MYSMLAAYFQYQRDMGVDSIVFGRGSGVGEILFGANNARRGGNLPPAAGGGATNRGGYNARPEPANINTNANANAGASALSKLSKIRTVDSLDIKKTERKTVSSINTGSAKREKLAEFYREAVKCGGCALSASRIRVVFGSGSADGRLMIIGDAPASQDEAAGRAFQGEAGELFGKMLDKMELDLKNDVFATYLQKCRSDSGFDRECAEACRVNIDRQIDIIEPKVLLIFGQPAANFLLGNGDDIEKLRAVNHSYRERPAIVTYDLSLMLTEKQYRHGAWDDMKKIIEMI